VSDVKKLSLDLETLEISSFSTGSPAGEAGTVQGHAATQITGPCKPTYPYVTCIEPCIPPPP
jgi:hypothetical protein